MDSKQFYGVHTALVTPFSDGKVNYAVLERLVSRQIEEGVDGLVSVGTTGESPTLDFEEHIEVIRQTVQFVNGRVPVIAGTGSNSTDEAIELTERAEKAGADAFLLVAPYYNKPSQQGLFEHFSKIAETTAKPIVLYSIPGRCGVEIGLDTVCRLHEKHPHICVLKESGASCDRVSDLVCRLGNDFAVLSGEDNLILPYMSVGAKGVICTTSNVLPREMVKMVTLALNNDFAAARAIHQQYFPIFKALFVEPNPVPAKYALHKMKVIPSAEVRAPLCGMTSENQKMMDRVLESLGLIGKKGA